MNITEQLMRDEGLRLKPYRDSVGKLTIGVGRNLDDVGISESEAMTLLWHDVQDANTELIAALPWAFSLRANEPIRFFVLVNMAFNMGISGLLQFHNTLSHVQAGNYLTAADDMLLSKWATQVGDRAQRLAEQMRTGVWQ